MCGILGVAGNTEAYKARFGAALDSIAHRGPDGEGTLALSQVILGHRRLAIIDLSPGGHQPMTDAASGTVITFNGEIYNYIEIRAELEALGIRCQSDSDTEVLLKAFLQWREGMFSRLNGMWAFAIWEPARGSLTLARDRFGVKPLYWHIDRGTLMFGSEPKALIAMKPPLAEPDPGAIYDLMVDSRAHARDNCFFKHIHSLPAAHVAMFTPGDEALTSRTYWQFPPGEGEPINDAEAAEQFSALFEDAVRLRLRSDVPLGLTLSGGLDSSAVLAAAQKRSAAPVRCFTSVYDSTDRGEERWAKIAAGAWGADLESVEANDADWLPTLEKIVHHMDGPGYTPAVFPLWAIMKRAREAGVPVLLEGQGADELLAGYPQYATVELASQLKGLLSGATAPSDVSRFIKGITNSFGNRAVFLWLLRQQAPGLFAMAGPRRQRVQLFNDGSLRESARVPSPDGFSPLRRALHADHADKVLPALLQYGDAISMAHGIEARLPFMDYRLVEWVFRKRPPLVSGGRTKTPVRAYLAANKLQAIADRPDKLGYPTLVSRWINEGPGKQLVADMLASPNAPLWQIVDRKVVAGMVAKARSGSFTPIFHLYKLVVTHIWLMQVSNAAIQTMAGGRRIDTLAT